MGRALGDAEDRGLVEQGVEDASRPEPLLEVVGDVVHAALARDVLAEDEELRSPGQLVGQGGVDVPGHGAGRGLGRRLGERAEDGRRASSSSTGSASEPPPGRGDRGRGAVTSAVVLRRGRWVASSAAAHTLADVCDQGAELVGEAAPVSASRRALRRSGSSRSTAAISADLRTLLGVGAGVAPQAHDVEVEEHRLASGPHEVRRPTVSHISSSSPPARR